MNWIPKTGWQNGYIDSGVDPALIEQYQECQPRVNGTDPEVVAEYEKDMRKYDEIFKEQGVLGWQKFPHISCVKTDDGRYILVSGFHRLDTIRKIGYERIEVFCVDGTLQDAILLSKGENTNNGIRRSNADKEHVVRSCLLDEELKKWSNEQIAEWCGVAPGTVKNHEERLCIYQRQRGENYERPVVRFYMRKDGSIGTKDTTRIGDRNPKQDSFTIQFDESELRKNLSVQDGETNSQLPFVYFIQSEKTDLVKIGQTLQPHQRLTALQTGSPDKLRILKVIHARENAEKLLHQHFESDKSHGEWFNPSQRLVNFIDSLQGLSDFENGTVGEKDTSDIGKRQKPKPNPEGCRKELNRTLSTQHYLNKSNVDTRALSETYHLSVEEVRKLKDKIWTDGLAAAKAKHKTARQCVSKEWLDWVELSDATTLDEVQDAACRQFAFLSKETFDGSREKLSYVDYAQLQREIDQLEKFDGCLVQRAGWLQALIPEPTSEDDEPKPDALRSLWEQVTAEMKLWKQRDKEKCPNPGDAISHASKTMLINALRQCNHSKETGAATEDELKQLLQLMKSDDFSFTLRVRHVLKASQPQEVDQSSETPSEDGTSESEPHPATPNLLIPDDPDNIKVCLLFSYPKANGFSHQVLGEELFELPRDIALPNDATHRNQAFATAFGLLKLLLVPTEDSSESDEELIEEGVAGIDLHALNDTLSALLERLGVDEMHYSFKQSLTADLYDVFLQYENVPNAKEMLIALLDTAHSVLSELT